MLFKSSCIFTIIGAVLGAVLAWFIPLIAFNRQQLPPVPSGAQKILGFGAVTTRQSREFKIFVQAFDGRIYSLNTFSSES